MGFGGRFSAVLRQNAAIRSAQEETKRMTAQMQAATQLRVTQMRARATEGKLTPMGGGGGGSDIGAMARARLSADVARERMSAEKEMEGKRLGLAERQGWADQAFKREKLGAEMDEAGLFAEEEPERELPAPKKKRKKSAWSAYDEMDYLGD